jgi:hypothetical protein
VRLNVFDTAVDVSVSNPFSALCGFTRADLRRHFGAELARVAPSQDAALTALGAWYGGYAWGDVPDADRVHNPYAVLRALIGGQLRPYWTENIVLPDWVREQLQGRPTDCLSLHWTVTCQTGRTPWSRTRSGSAAPTASASTRPRSRCRSRTTPRSGSIGAPRRRRESGSWSGFSSCSSAC